MASANSPRPDRVERDLRPGLEPFAVGQERLERFEAALDQDEVVVGRAAEARIRLDDRDVSRRHARLVRDGARWFVEDLGGNAVVFYITRVHACHGPPCRWMTPPWR
jgi:pSer/pThr/pTyr-binding forkhead associated (FHA) protein